MRGPMLCLTLMLALAYEPGQRGVQQEVTRLDLVRQIVRGPDRARRLAAFEALRRANDANLVRVSIDAALTHDDGVLQAAALREVFRRSPGFQVDLKPSSATLPPGRKFAAEYPRLTILVNQFDARLATLRVGVMEGRIQSGPGQLSGSLLTVGPLPTGAQDRCVLQARLSGPWLMEGAWRCRSMGSLDASIDLRRVPIDTELIQAVVPAPPVRISGNTVSERTEPLSRARREWSQEKVRAIAVTQAMSPARHEGRAAGELFTKWLEEKDVANRRTAIRLGLCHGDADVHSRAFAEFLGDLEVVVVREESQASGASGRRPGDVGPPGVSQAQLRTGFSFGGRKHVIVRRDPGGTLGAYWNGRPGTVRVEGQDAHFDFPAADAQACSFHLRPDCDGASTLEAAKVGTGQAARLAGRTDCSVSGTSAVEVDFREIGWRPEAVDWKRLQASIDQEAATIGELLDLLARPDPIERLGAVEALAASANPLAVDLALEFSLTSEQTAARALALPLVLARSSTIVVTIDSGADASAGTRSAADFGIIEGVAGERAGNLRRVRFFFPDWGAHLPLQVGATQIVAGDGEWLLVLAIDDAGELSGVLRAADGRTRALRALIR